MSATPVGIGSKSSRIRHIRDYRRSSLAEEGRGAERGIKETLITFRFSLEIVLKIVNLSRSGLPDEIVDRRVCSMTLPQFLCVTLVRSLATPRWVANGNFCFPNMFLQCSFAFVAERYTAGIAFRLAILFMKKHPKQRA